MGGIGEEGELERKGGERRTRGARGAVEEEESVGELGEEVGSRRRKNQGRGRVREEGEERPQRGGELSQ